MQNPPPTRGKGPKVKNGRRVELYIPAEKEDLLEAARTAMERDQSSLSAWFVKNLEEWWSVHKPGNPQLTLDQLVKPEIRRPGFYDVGFNEMWWDPKRTAWRRKWDRSKLSWSERKDLEPDPTEPGY